MMSSRDTVLFDGDGECGHYQVIDCIYSGRPARVLYSGNHQAAQSGVAHDDGRDLLFDYNQRFLELVRGLRPKRLLLIGGGAFTLPKALTEEFPAMVIDIVELDATLIDIARDYFDFRPNKRTRIYHDNGRHYLNRTPETYDVILIDAFLDTQVPTSLQTIEAMRSLQEHLRSSGVVAMNIIATYHGPRSQVLRRVTAALQTAFPQVALFPASASESLWVPQNFICVGYDGQQDLQPHVRYKAQELPTVSSADALSDSVVS